MRKFYLLTKSGIPELFKTAYLDKTRDGTFRNTDGKLRNVFVQERLELLKSIVNTYYGKEIIESG